MTEQTGATVSHTFAAPPEEVFDAWVTSASFAVWWGGDEVDVPLDALSMDPRPGGTWKATLVVGGGQAVFDFRGEYVEVDRPRRLVMTMTDEPGDARETLTASFTAVEGGTSLVFSQTGGNLTSEEYEATATAWQNAFAALDTFLTT